MLSYYVIYYENFRQIIHETETEALTVYGLSQPWYSLYFINAMHLRPTLSNLWL